MQSSEAEGAHIGICATTEGTKKAREPIMFMCQGGLEKYDAFGWTKGPGQPVRFLRIVKWLIMVGRRRWALPQNPDRDGVLPRFSIDFGDIVRLLGFQAFLAPSYLEKLQPPGFSLITGRSTASLFLGIWTPGSVQRPAASGPGTASRTSGPPHGTPAEPCLSRTL